MRALLVEVDKATRDLVKVALQQFDGTTVDTAEDNWALELIRENQYQMVVIADRLVQRGDGLLLLKDIRDHGCSAPAVVLSRDGGEEAGTSRDTLGIAAILTLPLDTVEIFEALVATSQRI